jgi:hypothetical protein
MESSTIIFSEYASIACGNPGALTVLIQILEQFPNFPKHAYEIFEKMKELRLYDYHIWVKYKECDKNIHKFIEYVNNAEL